MLGVCMTDRCWRVEGSKGVFVRSNLYRPFWSKPLGSLVQLKLGMMALENTILRTITLMSSISLTIGRPISTGAWIDPRATSTTDRRKTLKSLLIAETRNGPRSKSSGRAQSPTSSSSHARIRPTSGNSESGSGKPWMRWKARRRAMIKRQRSASDKRSTSP